MSTSHALLGFLAVGGARHGYELKHEYDRRLPGVRPLAFGQMYTTLARLVRDGWIAEAAHERVGGPDRTAYALTELGRAELDAWLGLVVEPAPHVSAELFIKVFVALLVAPDEGVARRYLAAQRARHLAQMRVLTKTKSDAEARLSEVAAADFLIAHLDADLRWMGAMVQRISRVRAEVWQR
jgi:DNA-binding PadR family transcriptional regulator